MNEAQKYARRRKTSGGKHEFLNRFDVINLRPSPCMKKINGGLNTHISVIIKHFQKCTVSWPLTPPPPPPPPPPLSTVMDHWSFLLLASSALFKSIRPADCQKWQVFCSSQCLGHVTLCFLFFEKKKKRNRIIIPNMIILKTEVLPHFNLRPHFQTKGKYGATLHSTHSHRVNHLTQETQDPVTAGTLIFSWLHWCCGSPSNVIFSAVH